jgi:DNA-binding SARP family transcriptional activator
VRLNLLSALAREDRTAAVTALSEAAAISELTALELADALGAHLDLFAQVPQELEASMAKWPDRWRPVLRRQVDLGDHPRARIAAALLDRYGAAEDVSRLRAYDKTYRRKGTTLGLGRSLAQRVSPRLEVHDLGQVSLVVGDRFVSLGRTRRKPAALLMYLVTRPNFTATREQIVEDLWPDGDISAGLNSLNQCLYFIRREIDPWYEDDLSPEYLTYHSELVSIDRTLAHVDSAEFLVESRQRRIRQFDPDTALALLGRYRGQFSPEFEYEEWALSWRTRVHGAYLDYARGTMIDLARIGDLKSACDIALRALTVDPSADDIERKLIWLYWKSGARSAAEAHYISLAALERAEGLDPPPLATIVGSPSLD